jgi:hypothetical protein
MVANQDGKHSVDYIGFAKEWNKTVDVKVGFTLPQKFSSRTLNCGSKTATAAPHRN